MRITPLACAAAALFAAPLHAEPPASESITAPGPQGPLAGTLLRAAGPKAPVALILPGSGPTDREGNNPQGVKAAPYRLLAEALAAKGITTVRIDKRGLFGSAGAIPDPNAVTISDYVADTQAWAAVLRKATGARCVWLIGHSEGGLIALAAAQRPKGLCGVVLVAAAGQRLGATLKSQLRANPANGPLLPAAEAAIDNLAAGRRVDPATIPGPLMGLFNPAVQGFLISAFSYDPVALARHVSVPLLVVQGRKDIQVSVADAVQLVAANPAATLVMLPDANHVLKDVADDSRAANLATYSDPALPLGKGVADTIAGFIAK